MFQWTHSGTAVLAAFSASLVECVEALTIVLAVGVTRGWRPALSGAAAGLGFLGLLVLVFDLFLRNTLIPLSWLQVAIGILLLAFGGNWLRKAILRAAGQKALHDEAETYEKETQQLKRVGKSNPGWDAVAFIASFKAILVEGIEVVFIIIAVSAAQQSMIPAGLGAAAALIVVTMLGFFLRKPLTKIPENVLKFGVGVILSAFGIFWIGEGSGFKWPGDDMAIIGLIAAILILSLGAVWALSKQKPRQ